MELDDRVDGRYLLRWAQETVSSALVVICKRLEISSHVTSGQGPLGVCYREAEWERLRHMGMTLIALSCNIACAYEVMHTRICMGRHVGLISSVVDAVLGWLMR